ncbi:MAG: peptidoglycan-binding domain-containing protein [Stellaceae bacterium]
MSENQFRQTVSRFTEALQQQAPYDAEAIESVVAAAIEKKIKDRTFVETELATAAAEKLLGWAKLFATFVAVPIGLLLLILSIFGISRFEDLRKVSVQADALVTEAQNRLTKGGAQFDLIRGNIDDLTKQLNSSQSALETQLAQIKQFTTSNENKIGQLTGSVNSLAGSVDNLQSASTSLLLGASGKSVGDLQARLKELGFFQGESDGNFGLSTVEAVKAFQAKNGLPADGLVGPQTRALLFKP